VNLRPDNIRLANAQHWGDAYIAKAKELEHKFFTLGMDYEHSVVRLVPPNLEKLDFYEIDPKEQSVTGGPKPIEWYLQISMFSGMSTLLDFRQDLRHLNEELDAMVREYGLEKYSGSSGPNYAQYYMILPIPKNRYQF